jgi:hypothetical protein
MKGDCLPGNRNSLSPRGFKGFGGFRLMNDVALRV